MIINIIIFYIELNNLKNKLDQMMLLLLENQYFNKFKILVILN